jgi:hypothetical protein
VTSGRGTTRKCHSLKRKAAHGSKADFWQAVHESVYEFTP